MLQIILFHNSGGHEDILGRCNKLSDDRNVESPGENIFMNVNFLDPAMNIVLVSYQVSSEVGMIWSAGRRNP